ncbi:hypothetical protein Tco_1084791, partial [Tanacetum coccineum]
MTAIKERKEASLGRFTLSEHSSAIGCSCAPQQLVMILILLGVVAFTCWVGYSMSGFAVTEYCWSVHLVLRFLALLSPLQRNGFCWVPPDEDERYAHDVSIVDPRVKVETVSDYASSPPRSRRKHRGVRSDDSLWDKPVEDFFSSESESDDDMENYIPPLPYGAFKDWEIVRCPLSTTYYHVYYQENRRQKSFFYLKQLLPHVYREDLLLLRRRMNRTKRNGLCADGSCFPRAYVHVLDLTNGKTMYMFVDKVYPIRATLLERMLRHRLTVPPSYCRDVVVAGSVIQTVQAGLRESYECLASVPIAVDGIVAAKDCWYLFSVHSILLLREDSLSRNLELTEIVRSADSIKSFLLAVQVAFLLIMFLLVMFIPADYVSADYALETATRILNMVPTKKVDKTPYELWYGKVPNLSYLKVWGCEALVKRDTPNKLQQRFVKCIFIGYPKKTMEVSGRAVEHEDTSPSENTSKIPMEVEGCEPPQEELILVR